MLHDVYLHDYECIASMCVFEKIDKELQLDTGISLKYYLKTKCKENMTYDIIYRFYG